MDKQKASPGLTHGNWPMPLPSLRDYFAGQALALCPQYDLHDQNIDRIVSFCYHVADKMLDKRAQG